MRRSSRNRCLRARLASRSFARHASHLRGPGVGMAAPQSRQRPRLYMRSRRFCSDFRELARRRSMLSGQQRTASARETLPEWPQQPQLAVSGGGSVSGGAEAGMQGMGAVSCWWKRAREPVGRPPAGHAPTTPSRPFRRTGRAPPFTRNRKRQRRLTGRSHAQTDDRVGRAQGLIGRRAIGLRSFGYLRTPLMAFPAGRAKGAPNPKAPNERSVIARWVTARRTAAILPASVTAGNRTGAALCNAISRTANARRWEVSSLPSPAEPSTSSSMAKPSDATSPP